MKKIKSILIFCLLCSSFFNSAYGQCVIQNKLLADGTMMYYFEATNFYKNSSKSLKIRIMTDNEHFFIALQPLPFPEKSIGRKIKKDLSIELANKKWYILKHYDTQYLEGDTVLQVVYLIDKKDVEDFRVNKALLASINMEGTEFVRNYDFKLHKNVIMEQLDCYFKSKIQNVKRTSL